MMEDDRFDLARFVSAQEPVIDNVRAELTVGRKRSHWMWFVFPQIEGLGISSTAKKYAISGAHEAAAYMAHPVLGPRLRECVGLALEVKGKTAHQIFSNPDDMKFRSCLTLFAAVSDEQIFRDGLEKYYEGRPDPATLDILRRGQTPPPL